MRKNKKRKRTSLKRYLSVFYLVSFCITALFLLFCGLSFAKRGSDMVSDGTKPYLITYDDAVNTISGFFDKIRFDKRDTEC